MNADKRKMRSDKEISAKVMNRHGHQSCCDSKIVILKSAYNFMKTAAFILKLSRFLVLNATKDMLESL